MPARLEFIAIALPVSPAISAWLSLVGMPKYQAATAHKTTEKSAAARAIVALLSSSPKYTIFITVSVTAVFNLLIVATPKKLKTADKKTALLSVRHLVEIQVATELGASVNPFT